MRTQRQRRRWSGAAAGAMACILLTSCGGQSNVGQSSSGEFEAESFFSGKTITVVIGSPVGGGGDTSTRLILDGLSDLIPGHPQLNPTNVDDIAGISQVYDAPEGQLVIGTVSRGAELYATMLQEGATHDIKNIQIVGGFGANPSGTIIFNQAAEAYAGLKEASGKSEPPLLFSEVVGDPSDVIGSSYFISWLCETYDLPCKLTNVANADNAQVIQDVARGTVNMIETYNPALIRNFYDYLEDGTAKILVEYSEPGATEVISPFEQPQLQDMLPSEEAKAEFERILPLIGYGGLSYPLFAGPNFPAEALAVISDAFAEKMSSPDNRKLVTAARSGDLPGVEYNPTFIAAKEGQELVDKAAEGFFANQSHYQERQKEFYDKYWK